MVFLLIIFIKKYSNIFEKQIIDIDNLYFDLNSLIHPQCYKIIEENSDWNDAVDQKIND